jgi:hypothetical protein
MCWIIFYIPLMIFDLLFGINFLKNGRVVSFVIEWRIYIFTPIDYMFQYLYKRGIIKHSFLLFGLSLVSLIVPSLIEKRQITIFDFILSLFLFIELKLELYIPTWFTYVLTWIARLWIIKQLIYNEATSRSTWKYSI